MTTGGNIHLPGSTDSNRTNRDGQKIETGTQKNSYQRSFQGTSLCEDSMCGARAGENVDKLLPKTMGKFNLEQLSNF